MGGGIFPSLGEAQSLWEQSTRTCPPGAARLAHLLTWTEFSLARTPFSSSFSSFVSKPGVSAGIKKRADKGLVHETKWPKQRRDSQLNLLLSRTILKEVCLSANI